MDFEFNGDSIKYVIDINNNSMKIDRYKNSKFTRSDILNVNTVGSSFIIMDKETQKFDPMFILWKMNPGKDGAQMIYNIEGNVLYLNLTKQ